MTLEQIKQLSDEEIRIKVAELLRWKNIRVDWDYFDYQDDTGLVATNEIGYTLPLPDYPRDLNACFEMEETLDDSQKDSFEYVLGIVIGPSRERWRWHLLHATARQRCEAFIAVKERET